MTATNDRYSIEISEIYEDEQEDFVIEKVKGLLKKNKEELKEHFKETDTIVIKKLSKSDAERLAKEFNEIDVKVEVKSGKQKKKAQKEPEIRCPKCGAKLEFKDWRCPECLYEFPDYDFSDDESSDQGSVDEESSDQGSSDEESSDQGSSDQGSDDQKSD
jgi:rubrerythrin